MGSRACIHPRWEQGDMESPAVRQVRRTGCGPWEILWSQHWQERGIPLPEMNIQLSWNQWHELLKENKACWHILYAFPTWPWETRGGTCFQCNSTNCWVPACARWRTGCRGSRMTIAALGPQALYQTQSEGNDIIISTCAVIIIALLPEGAVMSVTHNLRDETSL